MIPLLELPQRLNHFKRFASLHALLVREEFWFMCLGPLFDQTSSCLGTNIADRHPASKVKLGSLSLVFGMKVHWLVSITNISKLQGDARVPATQPTVELTLLDPLHIMRLVHSLPHPTCTYAITLQ